MQRFVIALFLLIFSVAASTEAATLGKIYDNGIAEVKTASYSLSFFPGCMLPFRLVSNGKALPEPIWLDRIVSMDGKQYYLNIERFAERRILSNTEQKFCVEMKGTYCLNDDVSIPGNIEVVYQYKCLADSVEVNVRISNPQGILWKEVHVLMPGWKKFPWEKLAADHPKRQVNNQGFLPNNKYVSAINGNAAITLYGDNVIGYTNMNNKYYSYLSAFRRSNWQDKTLEIKNLKIKFNSNIK